MKEPDRHAVELNHLYHGYGEQLVLKDVNLAIKESEFVTIVGYSGSGKTSLLKLIVGAEQPRKGNVKIFGVTKKGPNKDCTIVYQKYSLFPHLTVLENIIIGPMLAEGGLSASVLSLGLLKKQRAQYENTAIRYLGRMGLEGIEKKYPHELSGGMEQRVAIAQVLMTRPRVLLLDEPFSALDYWTQQELQNFLIELYQEIKMTVIFVTHHIEEAVFLGSRVLLLGLDPQEIYPTGSKILLDIPVKRAYPRPPSFKTSRQLNQVLREISETPFLKTRL